MFLGCTNVWWACTIALLPIQVSREISKTEKLLFGFDLAPTLIPGWCWSKFLMQPVFLGERGERKVSHGLLMESPALKLELSTTKKCLGWAFIWNLNPTEATCKLQFRNLIHTFTFDLFISVARRMRCFALPLICPEPPTFRPFIPNV